MPETALVLSEDGLATLDGGTIEDIVRMLYRKAEEFISAEHLSVEGQEGEALIWVQMYSMAGTLEETAHQVQGYILSHIQDHDLLRYHPARSNWGTLNEFIEDRIRIRPILSSSERADFAYITSRVIPLAQELGLSGQLAPTISALRAIVPRLRALDRQQDTGGMRDLLEATAGQTRLEAMGDREHRYRAMGLATRMGDNWRLMINNVSQEDFLRVRRALQWVEWAYTEGQTERGDGRAVNGG